MQNLRMAFNLHLNFLCEMQDNFSESAYHSIERLLTYDRKFPLEYGLDALNDIERELFNALEGFDDLKLTPTPESSADRYSMRLFYNSLGRLHIRPENEPLPNYAQKVKLEMIGYLSIPHAIFNQVEKNVKVALEKEAFLRAEIDAFLQTKEAAGQLQEVIDLVDDAVRHVEDVSIYIDDELFSVVADGNTNLIDTYNTQGLFSVLREKPIAKWTPAQRLALASFWFLFLSGRSVRFEEFNGKQLTACRLYTLLEKLLNYYTNQGDKSDLKTTPILRMGLFELAQAVGAAAQQSVGQPWLRYRQINGLTFLKTEEIAMTPPSSETDRAIPDSLAALYEHWIGKSFNLDLGYEKIFTELADAMIAQSVVAKETRLIESPAHTPLEILIQEIVAAALLVTDADYSMSSSLRDPSVLITEDDENRLSRMLALKTTDFYCCIASRPGLSQQIDRNISEQVYRPVQARMEYNRWHFIPGNFPKTSIPRSRNWFFPPSFPDLAELSDQHHPGHMLSSVKYCVRAPGPDLNLPPLLIGGYPYRGFYDVRVVRMDGVPFNLQEMMIVRHHCLWMGVVWRRIVNQCQSDPSSFKIIGFEKGCGYEVSSSGSLR